MKFGENMFKPEKSLENKNEVSLTEEQLYEASDMLKIVGKDKIETEKLIDEKADEFLESEPIKNIKEKKPGLIQKLAGSKFLKIAALTGSLLMAELGNSQETYGQEKKDKIEQRDEKSFEDNDIMQESLKSWLHFIKTGEYVEKGSMSFVDLSKRLEIRDKYGDNDEGYNKAIDELKKEYEENNKKIEEDFNDQTKDVKFDEMKKVYEHLETKMDVWNISSLSSFSSKLWLLNKMKNEGVDFNKFTKQPDQYPDWVLSNRDLGKNYEENARNNAANLYIEFKELLEQEE